MNHPAVINKRKVYKTSMHKKVSWGLRKMFLESR